ncbi:MAG: hypothetical protein EPN70_10065 [Paraburkholderia sp.]|uniref:PmeII family type II restriction endonuclease n=1 Tax=Paraburkholderia sp. TaxID=1926495 RepID=UPI001221FDA2|nr:PmeII family type II restriction endonuclease [Paraburkholderia sp.]TAM04900.1 MAG: hypothetical protein EPN70_10065 [Paraburkholderia sp.]TAM29596.1 MAG: hypothetical protein EPN59_11650 [Paraburkholderia sp.]
MARGHPGMPTAEDVTISKSWLLNMLRRIDNDDSLRARVLRLESEFRSRIDSHVESLPQAQSSFKKFKTSPFVLMMYSRRQGYSRISQIESDILPAKLFSSMETSAGKMIEEIVLPEMGWACVTSEMHTANSALDGKKLDDTGLKVATLKSGPACLNDEMSENFADAIISHVGAWANDADVSDVNFTYGVLYGTKKQSNKKDWHIIRNLSDKLGSEVFSIHSNGRWDCKFEHNGITVTATIRVGKEWWDFLGGEQFLVELCIALIRACVTPGETDPSTQEYVISDLAQIVSTAGVPADFNVALLQREQIPWLFFLARHFCDRLTP